MKRIPALLTILFLLTLSACVLPLPRSQAPTAGPLDTEAPAVEVVVPTDTVVPSPLPTYTEVVPPTEPAPAVEQQPTPYPPPQQPTVEVVQPTSQPTATQPAPTATSAPAVTFDPYTSYGEPTYQNPMEIPYYSEWTEAGEQFLPDDRNIRLRFKDGQLYVTGKRLEFSTWWFSYHTVSDAYIEMTFNSEDCSGEDAYGLIFRGSPHKAGISYGYVVSFTCEGTLWFFRLDDADPWDVESLVAEDEISAINTGSDEENVIGVRAEGDNLVIYANGVRVAEVEDDHFAKGRVGVYVRSARPGIYTYRVTDFSYWLLGEEE